MFKIHTLIIREDDPKVQIEKTSKNRNKIYFILCVMNGNYPPNPNT